MNISDTIRQNQIEIESLKALQSTSLKDLNKNVISKTFNIPAIQGGYPRRILSISLTNTLGRMPVAVLGVNAKGDFTNAHIIITRSTVQVTGVVAWQLDCRIYTDEAFSLEVQAISSIAGELRLDDLGGRGDWF